MEHVIYERLKSCPYCGGVPFITANYSGKTHMYLVFIKCEKCGAQGKMAESLTPPERSYWQNKACDIAVAAWNMRTNNNDIDKY